MKAPARILLVDDHAMVRRGFRLILAQYPEEFEVVGEAGTGIEALRLARELQPEIVVLDVAMPELSGIDVLKQISRQQPPLSVLMLSMHRDSVYVRETLLAGAKGYLLKDAADQELIAALRAVANGQTYLSQSVSSAVSTGHDRFSGSPIDLLTPREREVFSMMAEGRAAKDIAGALEISVFTVDAHRQRIFRKLQLRSAAELVRFALRQGIVR